MKYFCLFLMSIIGIGLFFCMMIKGWGLSVKSVWPIILYYAWWIFSLTVRTTIKDWDK